MKMYFKILLTVLIVFTLESCALRPIASQYDYQKNKIENVTLNKLGDGRILIYNGANGLHKIDNTARINMWIDDKPMGQIRAREYGIIELQEGEYEFYLVHIDLFKFKSTFKIEVNNKTKVIRIEPTAISNDMNITNKLPSKFEKYRYVQNSNKDF
tara:strand:- start:214 stop:681 length:468 start_codon:yes stop_codon:yes gene_type:complete